MNREAVLLEGQPHPGSTQLQTHKRSQEDADIVYSPHSSRDVRSTCRVRDYDTRRRRRTSIVNRSTTTTYSRKRRPSRKQCPCCAKNTTACTTRIEKSPNCTVVEYQYKGDIVRGTVQPPARAHKAPNSSGPMKAGSCEPESTIGNPVTDGEGEPLGRGGGSTMSMKSTEHHV